MIDKSSLLAYLTRIFPLSPGLKNHLEKILKFKKLKRGDFLLRAGSVCKEVCFIVKGIVRAFYRDEEKEISNWFMKEGDTVYSPASFLQQIPSYESIQCLENTELFYVSYDELYAIYQDHLEFNFHRAKLTEDYYLRCYERARCLRTRSMAARFEFLKDTETEIFYRVADMYLSSYIGMNQSTFSRLKSGKKN
jgi:CRP-like cAMP-binding protein